MEMLEVLNHIDVSVLAQAALAYDIMDSLADGRFAVSNGGGSDPALKYHFETVSYMAQVFDKKGVCVNPLKNS